MSPKKKLKLSELAGVGGTSDATLCAILDKLRATPDLLNTEPRNRFQIQYQNRSIFKEIGTRLTVQVDGKDFIWELAKPDLLVQYFTSHSSSFARLMEKAVRKAGGKDLSLVVYNDEVTPGNPLAVNNKRKFVNFYGGILEFGRALQNDACWLPLGSLRSSKWKGMQGKMSEAFRHLLRVVCLDGGLSTGVRLDLPSGPKVVVVRIANNLSDESALKYGLDVKGAAGLLPCFECANVCKARSKMPESDASGFLVPLTCADYAKLHFRSDAEVWETSDDLRRKKTTVSKAQFEREETLVGMNYNEHGVLQDKELRSCFLPVSMNTFDPTHVLYSNGVCCVQL